MASTADIVEGLNILRTYIEDGKHDQLGGAEHDIIYGPDVAPDLVSEEDQKRLDDLGWFVDSEVDSYAHFC